MAKLDLVRQRDSLQAQAFLTSTTIIVDTSVS